MKFLKQHWKGLSLIAILLIIAYAIYKAVSTGVSVLTSIVTWPVTLYGDVKSIFAPIPSGAVGIGSTPYDTNGGTNTAILSALPGAASTDPNAFDEDPTTF